MERIVVGELYADQELGLYVVRGENVVLLGDIDGTMDPPSVLQKVTRPHCSGANSSGFERHPAEACTSLKIQDELEIGAAILPATVETFYASCDDNRPRDRLSA